MAKVIGVTFKDNGPISFYLNENLDIDNDSYVIVTDEVGQKYGKVVNNDVDIDESKTVGKVNKVANKKDLNKNNENIKEAKNALKKCKEIVKKDNISMHIISCEYTFDRSKLIFKFLSDDRIDFRELVKKLALIYKTRIEMIQVGVRDKAKEVGGLGICGCKLCCTRFLKNLDSVSINMAKNQNISLNPSKINGVCGRLLCCLKYENDCYKECRKNIPNVGTKVDTEYGKAEVVSIDILKGTYKVDAPGVGIIEMNTNGKV